MQETAHEYALRVARGCARGIALGDFNEFKKVLHVSFTVETSPMTATVRLELRKAFDAFTSQDFDNLFTVSAYRPAPDRTQLRTFALAKIRAEICELQVGTLPDGDATAKAVWITDRVTSVAEAIRDNAKLLLPDDRKYLRRWASAARDCRYAEHDAIVKCPA